MCIWLDAHDQNIEMQDFLTFHFHLENSGTELEFLKT